MRSIQLYPYHDTRNASSTSRYDAHILCRILRLFPLAVQKVIVVGYLFAQRRESRHGRVFELGVRDVHGEIPRRGVWQRTCFWSTLTHVGPLRRRVTVSLKAAGCGPRGRVNNAGFLDPVEHWKASDRLVITAFGAVVALGGFVGASISRDLRRFARVAAVIVMSFTMILQINLMRFRNAGTPAMSAILCRSVGFLWLWRSHLLLK